jgi:hypothetical protein
MKKLISEKTVEQAFAEGKLRIDVAMDTIVTPQALTIAEKLGVEIKKQTSKHISYTDKQKIVDAVIKRFPNGKFSRAKIEKAVQDVLNAL